MKDFVTTIVYNDICFSYTKEAAEDLRHLYGLDIENLARPMMEYFDRFVGKPHVMEISFTKDARTKFTYEFSIKPK